MKRSQFFFSKHYEVALEKIEDFIFAQGEDLTQVERFLDEHDQALEFVNQNPTTAAIHPSTGDQSWIFSEGKLSERRLRSSRSL